MEWIRCFGQPEKLPVVSEMLESWDLECNKAVLEGWSELNSGLRWGNWVSCYSFHHHQIRNENPWTNYIILEKKKKKALIRWCKKHHNYTTNIEGETKKEDHIHIQYGEQKGLTGEREKSFHNCCADSEINKIMAGDLKNKTQRHRRINACGVRSDHPTPPHF